MAGGGNGRPAEGAAVPQETCRVGTRVQEVHVWTGALRCLSLSELSLPSLPGTPKAALHVEEALQRLENVPHCEIS